jgi:hypothetical protein
VELVPLSDGGWIACDQARNPNDPARIIAHLEAQGNDVCVTWVRERRDGCVYTTLSEALDAMARSLHRDELWQPASAAR